MKLDIQKMNLATRKKKKEEKKEEAKNKTQNPSPIVLKSGPKIAAVSWWYCRGNFCD